MWPWGGRVCSLCLQLWQGVPENALWYLRNKYRNDVASVTAATLALRVGYPRYPTGQYSLPIALKTGTPHLCNKRPSAHKATVRVSYG